MTGGDAVTVQWKSVGPLASKYIVEVRESTTSASNLFTRMAPQDATESLELRIQGLEAGRSYIACVRSVSHDGAESLSSHWSSWLTLPNLALQQFEFPPPNTNLPALHTPPASHTPPTLREIYEVPLPQPEKQVGAIQAPPQIPENTSTGPNDLSMMLFLD